LSPTVTFIVIAGQQSAAGDKTIASIRSLNGIETELLFTYLSGDELADFELTSLSAQTLIDRAFESAQGQYVQPLLAGQTIDAAIFTKQLSRLQSHQEASCIIKGKAASSTVLEQLTPGPEFLFNCFNKMQAPAMTPADILFRKGKVVLNHNLEYLAFTDLALQLSKQGAVIVESSMHDAASVNASNLKDWTILAQNYRSILTCLGWSPEVMLERLVEPLVLNKEIDKLEFLTIDEQLQAAAARVGLNGGASQRLFREADRVVVFQQEIEAREIELRALLDSVSWRLTKSLRDIRLALNYLTGTIDLQRLGRKIDRSNAKYLDYLNYEIDRIYKSNSWALTAPLRSMMPDKKLNSLAVQVNKT
jgi:hypothetical protein